MTIFTPTALFMQRRLEAIDMDWPPCPPSPYDELIRNKKRAEVRRHVLRLLKKRFPGLPY